MNSTINKGSQWKLRGGTQWGIDGDELITILRIDGIEVWFTHSGVNHDVWLSMDNFLPAFELIVDTIGNTVVEGPSKPIKQNTEPTGVCPIIPDREAFKNYFMNKKRLQG